MEISLGPKEMSWTIYHLTLVVFGADLAAKQVLPLTHAAVGCCRNIGTLSFRSQIAVPCGRLRDYRHDCLFHLRVGALARHARRCLLKRVADGWRRERARMAKVSHMPSESMSWNAFGHERCQTFFGERGSYGR